MYFSKPILKILYFILFIATYTNAYKVFAQRVNVVDNLGSIIRTGSVFTEDTTDPSSEIGFLDGDIWKNTITNDVFAFNSDANRWVKLISPTRKRAQYINGSGAPAATPLKIGPGPSIKNPSGKYEYINIDEFDIIIMGNASGQNYVSLEELSAAYDGKMIRISEKVNQNPKINVVDASNNEVYTFYPGGVNELFDLKFNNQTVIGNIKVDPNIGTYVESISSSPSSIPINIKYEFVDFIWQDGEWIPMR